MIVTLEVFNLRSIQHIRLQPSPGINVVHGSNGSGKTSLMEAISLLGFSRSFVPCETRELIRFGENGLQVFAEIQLVTQTQHRLGFGYHKSEGKTMRLDGDKSKTESAVKLLPLVVLSPRSFAILEGSSGERRKRVDWGLFHMKPNFLQHWKNCRRILAQRNANLKDAKDYNDLGAWNDAFITASEEIIALRSEYLRQLAPKVQENIQKLKLGKDIAIEESVGWAKNSSLENQLRNGFATDKKVGVTQKGAHKYDINFLVAGHKAKHVLSRGEKKLFVSALLLAQIDLLEQHGQKAIVVCDDLASEFDGKAIKAIMQRTEEAGLQTFVTTTTKTGFSSKGRSKKSKWKWFHVKRNETSMIHSA